MSVPRDVQQTSVVEFTSEQVLAILAGACLCTLGLGTCAEHGELTDEMREAGA